ncbi:hypothetical protein [Actinoplanes sp. NBRC 103695]|uniref:hypothetical protein n=1 Tax=Actinoplanes sp. NBRC 103695 TaxID=3032202 RepID=UPI0024A30652|nr:hypothetical protein [Actinoplanes sp. NBRC 103695]GLY92835.1 hypothetical protein Acsp02_00910 [Actinoplanes sp. NBRC 103695]
MPLVLSRDSSRDNATAAVWTRAIPAAGTIRVPEEAGRDRGASGHQPQDASMMTREPHILPFGSHTQLALRTLMVEPFALGATMDEERLIEGRLVKITRQKRQVVRIRAAKDAGKLWEYIFEFATRDEHISRSDIRQHATVAELVDWLRSRGANQIEDLTDVQLLSTPPDTKWLNKATETVDGAIDELIQSFLTNPHLHRVEHSLHLHLYELLAREEVFQGLHPIGGTGHKTQLIHKEWPETRPRPDKGGRGNFDFAILAPEQLAEARLDQFTGGHIEAAIVIEIGLNYNYNHLAGDHVKLSESATKAGYLVDLRRIGRRDKMSEDLICSLSDGIKGAFAYVPNGGTAVIKRVAESKVTPY